MQLVNARDVKTLGAALLPTVESAEFPPSLSPEQSAPPVAPVYLLHGTDDTVIPSVETRAARPPSRRQDAREIPAERPHHAR